jgi:hypothetical protein
MNKERRKALNKISDSLSGLQKELEVILKDEEGYRDNMPYNLYRSAKYNRANEAISCIDSAADFVNKAVDYILDAAE